MEVKKSAKGFRFREGDPVGIVKQPRLGEGVVRYVGSLEGYDGYWVGIELLGHWGKCDGSLKGVRYFACEPKQGIFARIQDCEEPDVGGVVWRWCCFAACWRCWLLLSS
jgi:CAP-Gly domain